MEGRREGLRHGCWGMHRLREVTHCRCWQYARSVCLFSGMKFLKNELRQPMSHSLSLSSHLTLTSSSSSLSSPLSLCVTPLILSSTSHSKLTFSINLSQFSLRHLCGQISRILKTFLDLSSSWFFVCFSLFSSPLFDSCDRLS